MSDGSVEFDSSDHVVAVITKEIEEHFDMGIDRLQAAVTAMPLANPAATEVVTWYGLLVEAQTAVGRAEDTLLASLDAAPTSAGDPIMGLALALNAAVQARDGRVQTLRWLLDPDAPEKNGLGAVRLARLTGRGPAVQTSPPPRPASAPTTVSRTGRATR